MAGRDRVLQRGGPEEWINHRRRDNRSMTIARLQVLTASLSVEDVTGHTIKTCILNSHQVLPCICIALQVLTASFSVEDLEDIFLKVAMAEATLARRVEGNTGQSYLTLPDLLVAIVHVAARRRVVKEAYFCVGKTCLLCIGKACLFLSCWWPSQRMLRRTGAGWQQFFFGMTCLVYCRMLPGLLAAGMQRRQRYAAASPVAWHSFSLPLGYNPWVLHTLLPAGLPRSRTAGGPTSACPRRFSPCCPSASPWASTSSCSARSRACTTPATTRRAGGAPQHAMPLLFEPAAIVDLLTPAHRLVGPGGRL